MRTLTVCMVMICFMLPLYAQKRIALVIGNSNYQNAPLTNPLEDSSSMAQALQELGFETMLIQDATRQEMQEAIKQLAKKGKRAEALLFYFAGHGIEYEGANYLLPVGIGATTQEKIPSHSVSLDYVLAQISYAQAKTNLIFLDSCRNNPLSTGIKNASRGLIVVQNPPAIDSFIMFATAPGHIAADGNGAHSPFTESLLENLGEPHIEIEQLAKKIRQDVRAKTQNVQDPWATSNLSRSFFFVPQVGEVPYSNEKESPAPFVKNQHNGTYWLRVLIWGIVLTGIVYCVFVFYRRFASSLVRIKGLGGLNDFYIARVPVTYKAWNTLVKGTTGLAQDSYPVNNVSWYDAVEFCNELSQEEKLTPCYTITNRYVQCDFAANGYRLPREQEWVLAAGNARPNKRRCWYGANSGGNTHPVRQKACNRNGLFDMQGNVYEWCNDDLGGTKVVKGGCYDSSLQSCMTTTHKSVSPDKRSKKIGFRVVRNV